MNEHTNGALLEWYRPRRRRYPWRRRPDPYRVLVSEVMLQQTQAARVAQAFERFVAAFPDVRALAAASRADVLRAWGSLGYNRRAVALHAAAGQIIDRHRGRVPSEPAALRHLPGVGPYTSAAVASLAFGSAVPAVDTNVARVVSRARLGTDRADRRQIDAAAERWIDPDDPGAWNQALMDLGREVCRLEPRCELCPIESSCRFRVSEMVHSPAKRRQSPFPGSFRQVRGAIVRALRSRPNVTLAHLASELHEPPARVADGVRALAADGVVHAGPAALAGSERGRVRLPS